MYILLRNFTILSQRFNARGETNALYIGITKPISTVGFSFKSVYSKGLSKTIISLKFYLSFIKVSEADIQERRAFEVSYLYDKTVTTIV